jgi:Family of unknown function (DUF6131)
VDLSGSTRAKMPAKDKGRKPTLPSVCRLRGCCAGISCAAGLIGIIAGQAHTGLSCTVEGTRLIILGIVLFVVGTMAGIAILKTIGVLQLVIGVILWVLGSMGRAVGGRKHYY